MSFIDSSCNIQAVYLIETYDKISGSFNPSRMQCSLFLFTDPFCTTQKSLCLGYKNETVNAVYGNNTVFSEINTKHRNTHCGQKLDTVNVKTGGIWSNH